MILIKDKILSSYNGSIIFRVVSDNAKGNAADTFQEFLGKYKEYSWTIVNHLLNELGTFPST